MVMTNSLKAVWPRIEQASKDNALLPLIREWAEREGLTGDEEITVYTGDAGCTISLINGDRATAFELPLGFEAQARSFIFMFALVKMAFNPDLSQQDTRHG